ncbi:MAG: NUDIX domain-containing protein [Flavobacteriaceae bacterium]
MDELVDILDSDGAYTGEQIMKSEAHKKGLYHPTVHIWLYTNDGRILIQKRGSGKKTYPLLWDVSVAGHVGAGENILSAAIRETHEEIGLQIEAETLEKIGIYRSEQVHHEDFKDFEFHHSFICELQKPLKDLRKQKSEVEELKLIPLIRFAEETWGMGNSSAFVPHHGPYYKEVAIAIRSALKRSDKSIGLA